MTTVLGIHIGHDAGAAIVKDGKLTAATSEERLSGIKHHFGFPKLAINTCLQSARLNGEDIDLVSLSSRSYSWFGATDLTVPETGKQKKAPALEAFEFLSPHIHSARLLQLGARIFGRLNRRKIFSQLKTMNLHQKEIHICEHHNSHAVGAYYVSPFCGENALVLTSDLSGDGLSSTVSTVENGKLLRVASSSSYDSLGMFYSYVTEYLGMKKADHEYKVMGLAPYGKAQYCEDRLSNVIVLNPKEKLRFRNISGRWGDRLVAKFSKTLRYMRFDNIAAAVQNILERLLEEWVAHAIERTGLSKIVCSGGTFLNVKANMRILGNPLVKDAFFNPFASDEGLPIGAAIEGYRASCERDGIKPTFHPLKEAYLGPQFSNRQIAAELKKRRWDRRTEYFHDIEDKIARLVYKGYVVARFNGRMEFGPRALGNRSILADPRNYTVTRKINHMIKQRDFWMPFAPTILSSRKEDYLVEAREAPYMILAFETVDDKRDEIIAALHPLDYTCRPQTLISDWNHHYHTILEKFERLTGVGGILNTSFNLHGYPIVCDPAQALWTLANSRLDYLAIGNYLVRNVDVH